MNLGQSDTKKLLAEYSSRLLCVRYRRGPATQTIINTVAILVEEPKHKPRRCHHKTGQIVTHRIGWKEYALHLHMNQAEARWNQAARLWELFYARIVMPCLKDRIVTSKVTIRVVAMLRINRLA